MTNATQKEHERKELHEKLFGDQIDQLVFSKFFKRSTNTYEVMSLRTGLMTANFNQQDDQRHKELATFYHFQRPKSGYNQHINGYKWGCS